MNIESWEQQVLNTTPLATKVNHRNIPGYVIAEADSFTMHTYYPVAFLQKLQDAYPEVEIVQLSYVVTFSKGIGGEMFVEEFKMICKQDSDMSSSMLAVHSLDERIQFSFMSNASKDDLVFFRFIADEMHRFVCEEGYHRMNHLYHTFDFVVPESLEALK